MVKPFRSSGVFVPAEVPDRTMKLRSKAPLLVGGPLRLFLHLGDELPVFVRLLVLGSVDKAGRPLPKDDADAVDLLIDLFQRRYERPSGC